MPYLRVVCQFLGNGSEKVACVISTIASNTFVSDVFSFHLDSSRAQLDLILFYTLFSHKDGIHDISESAWWLSFRNFDRHC